jgi:hypothetical protein
MQRRFEDYARDAGELARRTNVHVIALSAALLYAWLAALEPEYAKLKPLVENWEQANVILDNQARQRSEILLNIEQVRASLVKAQNEIRVCSRDRFKDNCLGSTNVASKAEKSINRAREALQQNSEARKKIDAVRADALKEFEARVDFDVGLGLKLKVALQYAAAVWLLLLTLLVARILQQRAKFWSLIAAGLRTVPRSERSPTPCFLPDMPMWVSRAPALSDDRVAGATFLQITGVHRLEGAAAAAVLAAAAIVAARVTATGLIIGGFAAAVGSGGYWATLPVVVAALSTFGLLALLVVPWWTSSRTPVPKFRRRERRRLIAGGLAAVMLSFAETASGATFALKAAAARRRAKAKALFFRRRPSRWWTIDGRAVSAGWYRNLRSKSLHLVRPENQVRWARGLKAEHLRRERFPFGQVMSADGTPAVEWVFNREFEYYVEVAARYLVHKHRPEPAIALLVGGARHRAQGEMRSALALLDRAAAYAKRLKRRDQLGIVVDAGASILAAAAHRPEAPLLESRMNNWRRILERGSVREGPAAGGAKA